MSNTDDHIQIISSSPTGATISTDYHALTQRHWQVIKINTGGDGNDALLSDTNPIPVSYTINSSKPYVPVAGSTDGGQPVIVAITGGASLDVSNVDIGGGTLSTIINGVSADIRTIKGGITLGISTIGQNNKVAVTGDVKLLPSSNNIGDVDVLTVAIPSGITYGGITATDSAAAIGSQYFDSGMRIVNNGGTNTVYVGNHSSVNTGTGFPLNPYDAIFLEVTGAAEIFAVCATGLTANVRFIGS